VKPSRVTFNHNPLLESALPAWRAWLVFGLLMVLSTSLVVRAAYLQGFNNDFLQAKGESRYARTISVPATRGRLLDRHGELLAVSAPVRSIWAIPSDAKTMDPPQLRQLASLLEMDVQELNRRITEGRDFLYLKRQLPPEMAQHIIDLKFPGVHQEREYRRYYPAGEMTAHILGFTGVDDQGQEGVELAFDTRLTGQSGLRRVIRDRRGQVIEDVELVRPPRDGEDIHLSIDSKIQFFTHAALTQAIQAHQARGGSAIVLDAQTGEVLALVNNPTYNPNNRRDLTGAQLRNRAITDTFEPGSTIKPFIAALALESGRVRPDTRFDTGNGRMNFGSAVISDVKSHGVMTVTEIVQKSSNVGSVRLGMTQTAAEMHRFYAALGLGTTLNIGFPGEAPGRLRPWKSWRPIEQATMSYGYGLSSSLIQMTSAYLVLTGDGRKKPLSLLRLENPPSEGERLISPQTAASLRVMLEAAALPGGTAVRSQVPGYRVAGKTGTAHKIEGGQYVKKYISSFIGFAPASDPRIVVGIMIDEPSSGQHYGGAVAAPVFSQIAGEALRLMGVAPDAPLAPLDVVKKTKP
jgi:cell division protein FtsI (penicillin-binding protein 3)